jgi:hypothetical protein
VANSQILAIFPQQTSIITFNFGSNVDKKFIFINNNSYKNQTTLFSFTEWLRKLESLFFILPRDVAVFTINLRIKKIYLIKWQHRSQYFVQLSLFLTIVNVTVSE